MVAQIIVSQEDSTSFFSIGSVQDDAALVSALGGALASFAVEMGLSDIGTTNANYSRFQNGVLISKWLEIDNYRPSIMIAVRDYGDLEQYHYMFLIDYGSLIATRVVNQYEKMYASSGEIPLFKDAINLMPKIAFEMNKNSPNTLKEFAVKINEFSTQLLEDMWENQSDKGIHPFNFRTIAYSPSKIEQIKTEFVNHFYLEGANQDALFPLNFSSSPDTKQVAKTVNDFLRSKSQESQNEIVEEIRKVILQLGKMSSSRSRKGKVEIDTVEFVNADLIFEQVSVAKLEKIDKERDKILEGFYKTLIQKLYQNYPLKFIASNYSKTIDIDFISEIFRKTTPAILNETFSHSDLLLKQMSEILRDITADFSPEEAIKNNKDIISKAEDRFIRLIKKQNPFVILADTNLKRLQKEANKYAKTAFEHYRSAHDEAMALWYILREINKNINQLKTASLPSLVQVHFIQELVRKYQFRTLPKMVYGLTKSILNGLGSSTSKDPTESLILRNISSLQKSSQISIPEEIKKSIIKQFSQIRTKQSFENIEALSFFSRAFSLALESSIVFILEMIFGTKEHPQPPKVLAEAIEKTVLTSQGLFSFSRILDSIVHQPGAQELFTKDAEKIFLTNLKYKTVLPSPQELARVAYETGWFVELKVYQKLKTIKALNKPFNPNISKNDSSNISDSKLMSMDVIIPTISIRGKISDLVKDPAINTEMWLLFAEKVFRARYLALKKYHEGFERKSKTSAGTTAGKKKYANTIKKAKVLIKAYEQILSGGNVLQKLFMRKKDLNNLLYTASRERFPGLNYYPDNFTIDPEKGVVFGHKISFTSTLIQGGFSRLTEIYSSTWVRDSEYIRKLKEEILWRVLDKDSKKIGPLEKKILERLESEAAKGGRIDQETVVRNTIQQEVSILFRKAIREAITLAFDSIRDDLLVRIDSRTKENYIKIGEINLAKQFLQPDYEKLKYTKLVKAANDKTEVWLKISDLLSINSRKKKAHSLRIFLRDGIKDTFRTRQFKALNIMGELIEQYIGEKAANLFYSQNRILEQLILESIDES